MNILFLFGHKLVIGGHFKSAQAFISELTLCGHKVYVLAPNGTEETIKPFLQVGATFSNIIYLNKRDLLSRFLNLIIINKQIKETIHTYNIDVIHAQDSPSLREGFKAACFYKKPFILTQAGGPFINYYPPAKIQFILYSQELYERYLTSIPKLKSNFHVISERINSKVYKTTKIFSEKTKYNLPRKGITFFFAMRLHEQKRAWIKTLFYFIDKIGFNEIINFVIAGDGTLKNEMIEKSNYFTREKPNLNFIFTGEIANETEINKLINLATICIGNGRLLMEAMACGKPVIILGENSQFEIVDDSNIDLIREFNFSGRHFDKTFYNIEEQKNKIEKMITVNEINKYGDLSYKYFNQFLSSEIGIRKLLEVYYLANKSNKADILAYISWLITTLSNKYSSKFFKHNKWTNSK